MTKYDLVGSQDLLCRCRGDVGAMYLLFGR